ncbi:GntR family transcriptional regulator [Streptomyces nymphaeiformis]|uniref:DNA-binding GntR family transcriptional regulator n=1 Tax=Streptomyces nymphaeiformis TaxID=2663842 RepID=A0A7W7XCG0_9ACTN|nr:GntR family transcriptional regulator [Streptomyces nymphaeiformis]MBB4983030.1 DNA-binding GntR family transcriptional regulator [Streptomyces nymphaeiformis]
MPVASPRGTYMRIAEGVRKEISEGKFKNGILPSEAAMADKFGVARNTIRRALKSLESDKLVVSVPGAGWRIASAPIRPLVQRLTELIIEDSLSIGDGYPSESQLCARFDASRTAVRRALAQMEGSGLLIAVHGKGRTVRALPAVPE